ncbi:hypothetical protein BW14_04905 [Bifidobacterium sp. UTBIF-68]|uniref:hypothetical protein n=1 Tax=Bifidobacterium sp. UTBIF-68 TaxID=1465262 RepID=UPI00112628A0|nr:hypothetical protein [Bifidobacterium sp. UTBIF-68]TPF93604.1 hypothetical protein BW14_04905 [Bifidobacterium sp. UTBIF-68]
MSEQQREQVRRLIAEQVGITSPFILVYDTSGLDETMAGGAHLDYLTDPHSSTFTIIGMLSCLLAWLTKGHQS